MPDNLFIPTGSVLLTTAASKTNMNALPEAGTLRVLPESAVTLASLAISDTVTLDTGAVTVNPVQAGLTAFAGGGQSKATQLNFGINEITTCATAGDSVKLPSFVAGVDDLVVINAGAKNAQLFSTDAATINGVDAVATGISITAGTSVTVTMVSTTKAYT